MVYSDRIDAILEAVALYKYIDARMIYMIGLPKKPTMRKVREILTRTTKLGELKRFWDGYNYIYYMGRKSHLWQHTYARNRIHFYGLMAKLNKWQKVLYWETEPKLEGRDRADGLYIVKTTMDGGRKFFLEVDRATRQFNARKYVRLYNADWRSREWADPVGTGASFPLVVVASLAPDRIKRYVRGNDIPWVICTLREAEKGLLDVITSA